MGDMGFLENRIEKALLATSNRGMEPAMEWLLSHADDPDIDDPIPEVEESTKEEQPIEQKAPLTEEEKEEQKKKIEEKIKQRRQEREEREKQEALDREKRGC